MFIETKYRKISLYHKNDDQPTFYQDTIMLSVMEQVIFDFRLMTLLKINAKLIS